MYYYYQKDEKSQWLPLPAKPGIEQEVRELGGVKLTILALSEVIEDEETERDQVKYKGPLYFDIDDKNLAQACASARQLVQNLLEMDVPAEAIQVFASGGKGFHIMVPQKVFSTGYPQRLLPKIYAEMARELYVIGMDFQVYSLGRGRSWRLTNLLRDNGNYRVQLTHKELAEITGDNYAEFVAAPREPLPPPSEELKAPQLEVLYEKAKKRALAPVKREKTELEETALAPYSENPPPCVDKLLTYKVRDESNFNQAALQFAAFAARSGAISPIWKPMVERMAENAHSTKYATPQKRKEHLHGMVNYVQHNRAIKFSCGAMRSVVGRAQCEGCPLEKALPEGSEDEAGNDLGITEKEDGYYIIGAESDRKISTFILKPVAECIEKAQGAGRDRRVGTLIDVYRNNVLVTTTMFDEASWASKQAFVRELEGTADLAFTGSETDVQRIKHIVYREGQEMGEIVRVYSVGIHPHTIGGRDVLVYVEPGFSVNQLKVQGTHELAGKIPTPSKLAQVDLPKKGDPQVTQTLSNLLNANAPQVVAQLVGWFCAAHLKTQFMKRFSQFPILSLWGNAGSGKCLGRDVDVLMYDGTVKPVQEVREGDLLMGPDSTPRRVLSTNQGRGPLYRITPTKGDPWVCNDVHIMTLAAHNNGKEQVFDVGLDVFLANQHLTKYNRAKLMRVPVEFEPRQTGLDPYLMGAWLGDGTVRHPSLTVADDSQEIIDYCRELARQEGWTFKVSPDNVRNTAWMVSFRNDNIGGVENPVYRELRKALIDDEKRIPREYLVNDRETRLQVLAGLLDTDGYLHANCYEFTTKYIGLRDDVLQLCRTLGLAAYASEKKVKLKDWDEARTYYRISISGHTDMIPCKVKRKQATPRKTHKTGLRTAFKVEPIGEGDYYGFTLDGDRRFLLGDTTVTHNTASASLMGWLNGCDYSVNDSPLNVSSVTPWALIHFCSSSTTVPRLIDEFNKSKIGKRDYDKISEIIKAAWGNQTIGRGTLSKSSANGRGRTGAEMVEIPISGPLVIMSEQAPATPAVQQRSVQVMMSRQLRKGCKPFFDEASANKHLLLGVAKGLMLNALTTPVSWVEERMAAHAPLVPSEIDERPRYSFQVIFVGLDLLEKTAKDLGLDVQEEIDTCRKALVEFLEEQKDDIMKSKARSEVDQVLEDLGVMAALTDDQTENLLHRGKHFTVDNGKLYLDLPICHALYKKYKGGAHNVVIQNITDFATLLQQEPYYETNKALIPKVFARPVYCLNLQKMEQKGHVISMFQGG